ncbi:hypothetical protein [Plantactinospora sp. CA-290183]|uniref:hypothetical protein n=1 Tax=Plantactinospora sp. CA-290183 TaxID=3240006 RepID=UPI003D9015A0
MPNGGVDLGADLYDLWKAGKDNLPSVAGEYTAASNAVGSIASGVSGAFMRPAQFGGTHGPAYAAWSSLRNELESILEQTATNLTQTGQALCLAATRYAASDSAADAEFKRLRRENGEPHA